MKQKQVIIVKMPVSKQKVEALIASGYIVLLK